MQNLKYLILFFLVFTACKEETLVNAESIIDKTIEVSGGEKFLQVEIEFDFRDKHYKATRDHGIYQYEREFKDSTQVIRDVLNNDGFKRYIDGKVVAVADSMAVKYAASVNSVHYFALLPYGLNDPAVNKKYLGEVSIKEKNYHKVQVTFNEEGGGEDHDDLFVYWVNTETFTVDYLAYSFKEYTGDLGLRFREAYNSRLVNGLRFVDYNNFKTEDKSLQLFDLDKAFENDKLKLLSKIELKNISVK
ncbi:DUF6503 family protein [Oceanihabitans sediminis]|uniref:DUF6503 family protein n=1 Tax=Oceanihabitans sediminis TaxID=1812012 RepID=UPI00299E4D2B|nr:DUF6503 family protein [Oceanihabitans sediminis]MDX1279261.1 DUF6503 family protein [Oceanihabitans sediminis]